MVSVNFAENLKKIREKKGISKAELARRVGVSDVTAGQWESGKISPRMGKVEMIADALGVETDDLIFDIGSAKASESNLSFSLKKYNEEQPIETPGCIAKKHPNAFFLEVANDSINKIIPAGAYVLIDPTMTASNSDLVAAHIEGIGITLMRYYRLQNTLVLEPDSYNHQNSALTFDWNNEISTKVNILGKVVWYMSPFNTKY